MCQSLIGLQNLPRPPVGYESALWQTLEPSFSMCRPRKASILTRSGRFPPLVPGSRTPDGWIHSESLSSQYVWPVRSVTRHQAPRPRFPAVTRRNSVRNVPAVTVLVRMKNTLGATEEDHHDKVSPDTCLVLNSSRNVWPLNDVDADDRVAPEDVAAVFEYRKRYTATDQYRNEVRCS